VTQASGPSAPASRPTLSVVVPGDLETRTGGYGYDRRIVAGLRALGWQVDVVRLDDGFPFPTPAARESADRCLASIPDGGLVLADGLAFGALPDEAARHARRLAIVALVHHPLASENGLDPAAAAGLEKSERRALASARAVIVTSRATARSLDRYGVAADRIHVVEPGTDPAPLARGSESGASLLCVATLTPRKGYEVLVRAVAAIRATSWRLRCAGSLDRDAATVARVRELVAAFGIDDRVALLGDLDTSQLAVEYERADLFVLPTLHEGYGMAVGEALARGLPVVSTATGAIAELVGPDPAGGRPEAGIVVPPGDAAAFADALARVVADRGLRARLAAGARAVRNHLPSWDAAAANMARALDSRRG
jgi:glycosyltransferase involved in cell wall biosynthesis